MISRSTIKSGMSHSALLSRSCIKRRRDSGWPAKWITTVPTEAQYKSNPLFWGEKMKLPVRVINKRLREGWPYKFAMTAVACIESPDMLEVSWEQLKLREEKAL